MYCTHERYQRVWCPTHTEPVLEVKKCEIRMTFGEAMVVGKNYYCWDCYVEVTGADTATVEIQRKKRFWKE